MLIVRAKGLRPLGEDFVAWRIPWRDLEMHLWLSRYQFSLLKGALMSTILIRLDALLKRLGTNGLDDVAFSGQIVNNAWHCSDCHVVGNFDSPVGPFPWNFVADKFTATCCSENINNLVDELSPGLLTNSVRALLAIDQAHQVVHVYTVDSSLTPFADLVPLDAAIDFQAEINDIISNVGSLLARVPNTHLEYIEDDVTALHHSLESLRNVRYKDPAFLSAFSEYIFEELGIEPVDIPVLVTLSPNALEHPIDPMRSYQLHGLTVTFALRAVLEREITTMPTWAYKALKQLGGALWLSKPYANLPKNISETAMVLWDSRPECPMYDFDVCVEAAYALKN